MDAPLRELTEDEIAAYDEHGVIVARGLFPDSWLSRMAAAVDHAVANPTPYGAGVSMEDQLFIKPAGCHVATPWHQDITFWPVDVESRQLCSIWITFDPVARETSGLEFVRGSHRWPERYKATTPNYDSYMLDSNFDDPPDIEANREQYDLYCPDMQAGDCLIFDAHVLPGPIQEEGAAREAGPEAPDTALVEEFMERLASVPLNG